MAGERATYTYKAVDSARRQIRLLCLSPGQPSDDLEGVLHLAYLDHSPPEYETISYAWGDPATSASICLKDGSLMIPANTSAALRRARLADQPRWLWIDAVCINQQDTAERGAQVGFMGEIYSRSQSNLIHLLDDETAAHKIVDLVRRVNVEGASETDGWKNLHNMLWSSVGDARVDVTRVWPTMDVDAAENLLRVPWFRRLWVAQEARAAPANSCMLGSQRMPLLDILRAHEWMHYTQRYQQLPVVATQYLHAIFDVVDREQGCLAHQKLTLESLFWTTRYLEKSDPLDGVYALLGMLSEQPPPFTPDYTTPLGSLLTKVSRHWLVRRNNLDMLALINHRDDDLGQQDAPSWAYRADQDVDYAIDPSNLSNVVRGPNCLGEPTRLDDQNFGVDRLILEGLVLDDIEIVSAGVISLSESEDWIAVPMSSFGLRSDETERLAEFATTITCNTAQSGLAANEETVAAMVEYLKLLLEKPTSGYSRDWAHSLAAAEEAVEQKCRLMYAVHRKLAVTTTGKCVLGSRQMCPGDQVALLRGGRAPCLLRACDGEYRFIGEAYVQGLMKADGDEAIRTRLAAGSEEQIFVVR